MTCASSASTKRERALQPGQHRHQRPLELAAVAALVAAAPAISAASSSATRSLSLVTVPGSMPGLAGERLGVDEVAVVAERELACSPTLRYTGWALRHVLEPVVE